MNSKLTTTTSTVKVINRESDCYPEFSMMLKDEFTKKMKEDIPLFTTDIEDLFEIFLNNLPSEARQHYTCNACRHFVNKYGKLVTINDKGEMKPVMWDFDAPGIFKKSVSMMNKAVLKSNIRGMFFTDVNILGQPITGEWTHMNVLVPSSSKSLHRDRLTTVYQLMAEKQEDFRILKSSLKEYPIKTINQALTLLTNNALFRSEKCLGVAAWFADLHTKYSLTKNSKIKNNLIWYSVAIAPTGFCHIKNSIIGTLLDDIKDGCDFNAISRRFAEKMDPSKYQRPQADPSVGNIMVAEKIVETLGIKESLSRRYARLDEIEKIWSPKETVANSSDCGGVFSHLKPKNTEDDSIMRIPPIIMTWKKFLETVLPLAESIEYYVDNFKRSGINNYSAIVTAVNPEAKPIIQWDNINKRNPFSWYIYHNGSHFTMWGLNPGYNKVTGICYQPSMWYNENEHQGKGIFFVLDGAKDKNYENAGNALFPEILISELREIRSVIESYSKSAKLEGHDESSACGILLHHGSQIAWDARFRVKTNTGTVEYILDRWD